MMDDNEGRSALIPFLSAPEALEEGLRLGEAGIWRWRIDSDALEWTRNLEAVHDLPPGSFDGTLASFQRDLHPDDAVSVWRAIRTSVETGAPYRAIYRTAPRGAAGELWIETRGGVTTGPDGARYLTGVCLDVSDRVRGEQQLQRRLKQQHAIARFGSCALHQDRLQVVLDEAVRIAAEVLSVPLTKILEFAESGEHLVLRAGLGWAEGLVGRAEVGIERASQAGYTLLASEPVIVTDQLTETRFDGPQLLHDHKVRSGISVIIPGVTSRPFGVFGIHARDIRAFDPTDAEFLLSLANIVAGAARQEAAARHQTLLVREMAHRAGNMLQLVSSIATQTFGGSTDVDAARAAFNERLRALASSNYVVARGGWALTRFPELLEETLKPFCSQIETRGRDVLLPPELCFDLGLVMHELATNSTKYGTLGGKGGKVSLSWSYETGPEGVRVFRFVWDDPQPGGARAAAGSGFGSKLIAALVETKWGGRIAVTEAPGFRIALEVPVAA